MATMLHPTRGGKSSYPNQDRAIALARERDDRLILLYVSNVSFLDTIASPVPVDLVEKELDELGEFMLAMAQERAERAGLTADTVVRHGRFDRALKEVIQEFGVESVVVGSPADNTAIMTSGYLQQLVQFLKSETGVEVIIVHAGDIVEQHQPAGG